jgi:hypothetical protein
MMIDPHSKLGNRLYNWKFSTAAAYASELQDELNVNDYELILALEKAFGNVGYFDGNLATIVQAAVKTLVG